jgi:AcrR family transcriptional regulator
MTDVVGREGYHAASVQDVVRSAGVSRQEFYERFRGKEHCFVVACDQALAKLTWVTLEAFEAEDEWVDSLRSGLRALLGSLAQDQAAARLSFVECLAAGPKAVGCRAGATRGLARMYEAGREESRRDLPDVAGISMAGGLTEVLYWEIARGGARKLPRLLPELMHVSVMPFLGTEAASHELALR